MSISSPAYDFQLDCYRSPADGRVWWYYSWRQNGQQRQSGSFYDREAARLEMTAHRARESYVETGE